MKRWMVIFELMFITTGVFAYSISIDPDRIHLKKDRDGVHISVDGGWKSREDKPDIEWISHIVLLPPGTRAVDVRIISDEVETLRLGEEPAKVELVSMDQNAGKVPNNSEIDGAISPLYLVRSGFAMGYSVAFLRFYPVTYLGDGVYLYYRKVDFDFELKSDTVIVPMKLTVLGTEFRKGFIFSLCDDLSNFDLYPEIDGFKAFDVDDTFDIPPLPSNSPVDVVVLTDDSLISAAREFLNPVKYGFTVRFVSVNAIYTHYYGIDNQEKIRNFLRDAYRNWGFTFLYIVGDYTHIPVRVLTALGANGIMGENTSDLYYAVLDGNINTDGDYEFGESDEDDLVPDVFFARLEVRTPREIEDFAAKLWNYRFEHPREFFSNLLFEGASVQPSGTDNSGAYKKNSIIENFRIDTLFNITRMYSNISETGGDIEVSAENFIDFLRHNPFWFVNHFDHGNQINISMGARVGGGGLTLYDVANLENPYYPLFYSFSCDVNRLDTDNIARRWTVNPHGGGIGMYAHSNTAWTVYSNMDDILWDIITSGDALFTGQLLSVWISRLGVQPYCAQILGFCGDPLTPIPSHSPNSVEVSFEPSALHSTDSLLYVYIDGDFGDSIFFALTDGKKVISRGFARSADFSIPFKYTGADTVFLTIYSFPMHFYKIPVIDSGGVYPLYARAVEVAGDGDGVVENGERFHISCTVVNTSHEIFNGTVILNFPALGMVDSQNCTIGAGDTFSFFSDLFTWRDSTPGVKGLDIIVAVEGREDTFLSDFAGFSTRPVAVVFRNDEFNFPDPGDFAFVGVVVENPAVGGIHRGTFAIDGDGISPYPDEMTAEVNSPTDTFWFDFVVPDDFAGTMPIYFKTTTDYATRLDTLLLKLPSPPDSIWTEPYASKVVVKWLPPADSTVRGYYVFRADSPDGEYGLLNPVPITSSVFSDYSDGGREFYYRVASVDEFGNVGMLSEPVYGWRTLPAEEGFPVDLPLGVWPRCAPAFVDADGDGRYEIYVADIFGNLCAYHCDGSELVDSTPEADPIISTGAGLNLGFWAAPAVGDIDQDGVDEIVLADRWGTNSRMFAIDPWGNPKPGFPVNIGVPVLRSVVLYDLDGDGYLEIIAAGEYSKLIICRYDGTPYVGDDYVVDYMPERASGPTYSAPAVADLDGDGKPEIVCGGPNDSLGQGLIYMWNWDGTRREGFPITVPGNVWGSPVVGNLDSDFRTLEFAVYVDGCGIYAFDYEGNLLPGFPVPDSVIGSDGGVPMRSPALADFDGDGICEIVFTSAERVTVVDHTGALFGGFPVWYGNPHWSGPLVADIDGDGVLDVLSPNDTRLWAFDVGGAPITPGFPLTVGVGLNSPAAVFDVDGDGYLEIVAPALNSKVYVWKTFAPADTGENMWPHFRGNQMRTGALLLHSGNVVEKPVLPKEIKVSIAPNPFNSVCRMEFSVPVEGGIFTLAGRKVASFAGTKFLWKPDDTVGSGIFIVKAKSPSGECIERKVLYIR